MHTGCILQNETHSAVQLNRQTDYAFRILIYLADHAEASKNSSARPKIREIAAYFNVSYNHLMKVANTLVTHGYVESRRGKGGGLALARAPNAISLGAVARDIEGHWELVDCFGETTACRIAPTCQLAPILAEALATFWDVLDRYTLADIAHLPSADAPVTFHQSPGESSGAAPRTTL